MSSLQFTQASSLLPLTLPRPKMMEWDTASVMSTIVGARVSCEVGLKLTASGRRLLITRKAAIPSHLDSTHPKPPHPSYHTRKRCLSSFSGIGTLTNPYEPIPR